MGKPWRMTRTPFGMGAKNNPISHQMLTQNKNKRLKLGIGLFYRWWRDLKKELIVGLEDHSSIVCLKF